MDNIVTYGSSCNLTSFQCMPLSCLVLCFYLTQLNPRHIATRLSRFWFYILYKKWIHTVNSDVHPKETFFLSFRLLEYCLKFWFPLLARFDGILFPWVLKTLSRSIENCSSVDIAIKEIAWVSRWSIDHGLRVGLSIDTVRSFDQKLLEYWYRDRLYDTTLLFS